MHNPMPITTVHHHQDLIFLSPSSSPSPSPSPSSLPSAPVGAHRMAFHSAFYWGIAHQILFSGWPGSSTGMYVVAVFFVFFLAIMVEWLSHCQLMKPGSNRVAACMFRTGMHAVRAGFAYMVMLAVISYNGGIFMAAVVGHAVGYLIFGSGLFWQPNLASLSDSNIDIGPPKF